VGFLRAPNKVFELAVSLRQQLCHKVCSARGIVSARRRIFDLLADFEFMKHFRARLRPDETGRFRVLRPATQLSTVLPELPDRSMAALHVLETSKRGIASATLITRLVPANSIAKVTLSSSPA
jgi:hypothetical protein